MIVKGVNPEQLEKLKAGDWKWLVGDDDMGLHPPQYIRSWKASKDAGWKVVLNVEMGQRWAFTKLGKKAGVVWAPYLSGPEMQLRKQRTELFRSLKEEGYSPKWHGSAGIRYIKDGETLDYKF
ncbi:hypothetical protein GPECTOR_87g424 [Gonium pectorale]|uniref:Uncharacterized protein n=1 Tax=Gonium pectorale TaxID=33097 RepID=A0A150G163_GONPE|nr:hypothetical protein GPECTOR_87g424 [Gonium pectorale]|eukprot:KXZ43561.1 hypothetical protein GPECTOR_87g424 [Gonium pectorale]